MRHPDLASRSASWASVAGGLGALLLPKCALCFAAYASAFGALGVSPAVHRRLVEPFLAVAVATSVGLVWALAVRRGDLVTPLVSVSGAVLVLAGRMVGTPAVTAVGAAVLVAAAFVNSARCRRAKAAPIGIGGGG